MGRIAVSSIRRPRALLQLSGSSTTDDSTVDEDESELSTAKKFLFAHRSIDFVIEEGIRCVMDVEDVENLLFAPASTPEE